MSDTALLIAIAVVYVVGIPITSCLIGRFDPHCANDNEYAALCLTWPLIAVFLPVAGLFALATEPGKWAAKITIKKDALAKAEREELEKYRAAAIAEVATLSPADESHLGLQPKAVAEPEGEDPEQGGSE